MAGFSDFWEKEVLNLMFQEDALPAVSAWLFLATTTISDADTGATVSVYEPGNNYSRVCASAVAWASAVAGTNGCILSATLSFPSSTGSWGTITHWGICSASVAGNLICFASVATEQTIGVDTIVQFTEGSISVTIS